MSVALGSADCSKILASLSWLGVSTPTADREAFDRMAFRLIGEVLQDVLADLRDGMEATGSRGGDERAPAQSTAGNLAAARKAQRTAAARGREPRDHATRGGDPSAMGIGERTPTEAGAKFSQETLVNETTKGVAGGGTSQCMGIAFPGCVDVLPAGREMATAHRRRSKPHAPAVVISLAAWKAGHSAARPMID